MRDEGEVFYEVNKVQTSGMALFKVLIACIEHVSGLFYD